MRQTDFNTVACFTALDPSGFGYIDFELLRKYMAKFNKQHDAKDVNSVLRRLNSDEDFKISFREFASSICPLVPGYSPEMCATPPFKFERPDPEESEDPLARSKFLHLLDHDGIPYNLELKKQVLRDMEINKKNRVTGKNMTVNQNVLRNFKAIYEQERFNKVKNEFKDLKLKSKVKEDEQFIVDLNEINADNEGEANYNNAVITNRIGCGDARDQKDNMDSDFAYMWQSVVHGGFVPNRNNEKVHQPFRSRDGLSNFGKDSIAYSSSS